MECVKRSTRKDALLDLVLSDLSEHLTVEVLPEINVDDHKVVLVHFDFSVPVAVKVKRGVWLFKKADWDGLRNALASVEWKSLLNQCDANVSAQTLTECILSKAKLFIPFGPMDIKKSQHPWLNDRCRKALAAKVKNYGSDTCAEQCKVCSEIIMKEYDKYQTKMRKQLLDLPRSDKRW